MAKKKKDQGEAPDAVEAGGGKRKVILLAVVMIGVGAILGGKVLGGGGTPTAGAATTTTTEPPGMITTIDAITLNLADGRFLKLGLAFEVHHDATYPVVHGEAEPDEITHGFAREIDAAITLLSGYTYDQLAGPEGKADAKTKLLEQVRALSDDAVKDVFFHEFVMQ